MANHIEALDILVCKLKGVAIQIRSKMASSVSWALSDFEDDEYITKRAALEIASGIGSASIITYQSGTSQVATLGEDIQVIFDQPYQSVTGVQVVSGDITYEGLSKQYQTGGGAINGFLIIGGGSIPTPFRVDFVAQ